LLRLSNKKNQDIIILKTNKMKTSNKIKIQKARPEDAKKITEVFYKTWLTTYPNKKYQITINDIKDRYKNRITKEGILKQKQKIMDNNKNKNSKRFMAKIGNKVVGVCNITLDNNTNELKAIYVLPKYQGRGIGKLFWKKAQKYFNSKNKTIVNVAVYNKNAIGFYTSLGFVKTGKYFKDETTRMKSGSIIPEMEMILQSKKTKKIHIIKRPT
jgi:ribosomal protein S18 acetylase RimI-like enzyme